MVVGWRSLANISIAALVLSMERTAVAGGPLSPQGTPIQTSNYRLDLFQGPVLASSRITGLGGAYAAIAEGAEGIGFNPAAASQRFPYSTTYDDYDITGGLTFPSSVARTDFDNNGTVGFSYDSFIWGNVGAIIQHGRFALGASLGVQQYSLGKPTESILINDQEVGALKLRIFRIDLVGAYAALTEELHVGGGLRGAILAVADPGQTATGERLLFGTFALGVQGGALYTPHRLPLRVGVAVRSPMIGGVDGTSAIAADANGDRRVGSFFLPGAVSVPWEVEWGVAVQLGRRPLNIQWVDEDETTGPEVEAARRVSATCQREPTYRAARRLLRQRYWKIPRQKVLVSFGTLLTGPSHNAVGIESMLGRVVDRSGERASMSFKLGVEAEVIPGWLQLRGGTYMEPTRFRGSDARVHGTTGFEMRLVDWTVFGLYPEDTSFRASAAVDIARDYFGWSVGLGVWR